MTSINHSAFAGAVAVATSNMTLEMKAIVFVLLVISHVPLDAIPHCHLYDFYNLRKTWKGAIVELGGGFVIIPLLIWWYAEVGSMWLCGCVFAASFMDFAEALGIKPIARISHVAHWLTKILKPWIGIVCEVIFLAGCIMSFFITICRC